MKHYTNFFRPSLTSIRLMQNRYITTIYKRVYDSFLSSLVFAKMTGKKSMVVIITLLFNCLLANAQGNAPANETAKRKASQAVELIHQSLELEKGKKQSIQDIFNDFYLGQQQIRNNIQRQPSSGMAQGLASQDFQSVRKRNEALITERDNRLKKQLSADQYKKWKENIEPSLNKRKR